MTVAFVFSGGASHGAIQAGMLRALERADVSPDIVFGTSVGAMNAAYVAGGGDADGLVDIWLSLRGAKVFPLNPALGLKAFLGKSRNFVSNQGVKRVLRDNVAFTNLEDADIPITVMATDVQTGEEVALSTGPAIQAILASAALPGVFPPIRIGEHMCIDGGIANNTPISAAIEAGATEVWVLSTGYSCDLREPPKSAFATTMHSVGMLVQQRLQVETQNANYPVPVRLIPPPCPMSVMPTDFTQSGELIELADRGTEQWIGNGMPYALPYVGHRH